VTALPDQVRFSSPTVADVAVHAPTGRDGQLTVAILRRWGLTARLCVDMRNLCDAVTEDIGVLLVAEEALGRGMREQLLEALAKQPSWSDVPLIVLTGEGELSRSISEGIEAVTTRGNAVLLERPVRIATLITALRSALRARLRQFEIRDYVVERERLLESERTARAEAEEANRAKSRFLTVMSHELRTPLNAIGGYAELIELEVHGAITDAQREALQRIQRSERHLLGLIESVLSFARVEAGTVRFNVRKVATSELVSTAEAFVEPQVGARGLRIELDDCREEHFVAADFEKACQILLNLLSNALKFTPRGGTVTLKCANRGDAVEISVADTGMGIPANKLDSIFEPFVQVDTRLTRTQEGVGLGLAISRDLARGMGGDLIVASTLGKGTCFTLRLPVFREASDERLENSDADGAPTHSS
jgi:signal transduction histidine kinase